MRPRMKPRLIPVLVANVFLAAPALAQEEPTMAPKDFALSGALGVGLRATDVNATDASKFMEYRDLSPNGILLFELQGLGRNYHLDAFGENIGTDDQYIDLQGGRFGTFKYRLYDNEMRHRFGSPPAVRTPYSGVGTATLTAPFPAAAGLATSPVINPNTWNPFDSSVKRRDLGGFLEWSALSPWYFRVDANEVKRDGVRTISSSNGESPGNGFVELPRPVDWTTTNWSAEGGYQSKTMNFSLNVLHSRFQNGTQLLQFSNPFLGAGNPTNYDSKPLEPDNELTKWSLNGNLRRLPWNSTLAGRITWSKLTNNVSVLTNTLDNGPPLGIQAPTGPNPPVFRGEVINKTASLSYSSQPMRALDTRVYYNWSEKEDNSTHITFTAPLLGCPLATPCEPERFSYKKNNVGAEAGYRVNPNNRITGGVDYHKTDRHRIDFRETEDAKFFVQWRNHAFDYVDTRVKYQFLKRRSEFDPVTEVIETNNPLAAFVRRFDYANVHQNLLKASFDISPRPFLDFGVEAIYKNNDYKDTPLGRTEDQRTELYASVGLGDPNKFRVLLFGDIEYAWYDSRHRVGAVGGPDDPPAPAAPAISTSYTWTAKNRDKSWQVGLGADWKPMERLVVNGSLLWAKTEGTVDFSTQPGTIIAGPGLLPIGNFDNTRRWALNLKGTYAVTQAFNVTAGYAYERYRYSDIGYDGLSYVSFASVAPGGTTANSYVTGEGAFQNYTANILYLIGTYKF